MTSFSPSLQRAAARTLRVLREGDVQYPRWRYGYFLPDGSFHDAGGTPDRKETVRMLLGRLEREPDTYYLTDLERPRKPLVEVFHPGPR